MAVSERRFSEVLLASLDLATGSTPSVVGDRTVEHLEHRLLRDPAYGALTAEVERELMATVAVGRATAGQVGRATTARSRKAIADGRIALGRLVATHLVRALRLGVDAGSTALDEDIMQAGFVGLIEAARDVDPDEGSFAAQASRSIVRAKERERQGAAMIFTGDVADRDDVADDPVEVISFDDVTLDDLLCDLPAVADASRALDDEEELGLYDLLEDEIGEDEPVDMPPEFDRALSDALMSVSVRAREIVILAFGLREVQLSPEAIGEEFGLTVARIRQILAKTLRQFRDTELERYW